MKRKPISAALKRIIAAAQKWRCDECDVLLPASFEIDHVVPLHLGGSNERDNLVALCGTCHREKTYIELYNIAENRRKKQEKEEQKRHQTLRKQQEEYLKMITSEPEEGTSSIKFCPLCRKNVSKYFPHECHISNDFYYKGY